MPVYSFDNLDQMFEALDSMAAEGKTMAEEMDPALKVGLDHGNFCVYEAHGMVIFGRLHWSEYEEDNEMLRGRPELRNGKWFSAMCVEGELGTVYLSRLLPISEEAFNTAQRAGWNVSANEVNAWIADRVQTLRTSN